MSPPITMLVVDDDAGMRRSTAILLRGEGYVVAEARDGVEAAAHLQHEVPDLVITDLHMPRGSGFALLRTMQQGHPHTPVVATSALASEEEVQEALHLGARAVVPKPFQAEQFFQIIREALRGPSRIKVSASS